MLTLLLLACVAKVDTDDGDDGGEDTSTAAADTGDTSDSGDPGEVYELGDPAFSIELGGETWESAEGYWVVLGDESTIRAELEVTGAVQIVILTIDGDISDAGTHPLVSMQWVEQVSQAGDSFHYNVNDPALLSFSTLGFAEKDNLFARMEGTATMLDSVGGGTAAAGAAAIESWPPH